MRVVLELSEKDVNYFRKKLREIKKGKLASNEKLVLEAANELLVEVEAANAPEFVQERFEKLADLVRMLEDERWRLTGTDRGRILNVLAYFVDPDDMIPDRIPGLGYLDDAIMVGVAVEEFRHELEAYAKFCAFEGSADATEKKRKALQEKMRAKRSSERERRRLVKHGSRGPLGLW